MRPPIAETGIQQVKPVLEFSIHHNPDQVLSTGMRDSRDERTNDQATSRAIIKQHLQKPSAIEALMATPPTSLKERTATVFTKPHPDEVIHPAMRDTSHKPTIEAFNAKLHAENAAKPKPWNEILENNGGTANPRFDRIMSIHHKHEHVIPIGKSKSQQPKFTLIPHFGRN